MSKRKSGFMQFDGTEEDVWDDRKRNYSYEWYDMEYKMWLKIADAEAAKRVAMATSTQPGDAFPVSSTLINPDMWYIDSGASMHMTNRQDWMYDITTSPIPTITVANKTPLPVKNMGKVNLLVNGSADKRIQIKEVLYIPDLVANLLSVRAMVNNGCKVIFKEKCCDIYDRYDNFLCSATLVNTLYQLNIHREVLSHLSCPSEFSDTVLWHRRM